MTPPLTARFGKQTDRPEPGTLRPFLKRRPPLFSPCNWKEKDGGKTGKKKFLSQGGVQSDTLTEKKSWGPGEKTKSLFFSAECKKTNFKKTHKNAG
jgi:hypothetical protein